MSPPEIAHRVLRALAVHAERIGLAPGGSVPAPDLSVLARPWVCAAAPVRPAPYLAAAERIVADRLDVFALREVDLGSPPRWNRDPKTGIEAPLILGKLIDYRDQDVVGDCKYLWEPNRHLHLVTLAQAYALSGQRRYLTLIAEHLESWFLACPYRYGPNWASALEPAIRLINWSLAWQLVGGTGSALFEGEAGERLRALWLRSVYQHAQFVRGFFSLHSSANNHLIGEAAGLYLAALAWPHWRAARRWLVQAKEILEREVLLQNASDGVNREQSTSYQQYEFDLLALCLLAGKANGNWFSAAFESRIEAMLDYLASVMDAGGNVPMFGDSDDGMVVRLSQEDGFCRYRSVLAMGALLFHRGDFKLKAKGVDDKTRWLLGGEADARFEQLDAEKTRLPLRQAFPEGGYYILGCDFETEREIRLVADAGPLGYPSIAAHGHADALSFTLSVGGREFLVDPGTYAYHTQPQWRQHFRGTAAHNTVQIDALDQSVQGGNFMWLRKARAGCSLWLSSAARDLFEGWHDGYARLEDPVVHRRFIQLDKTARRIVLEDALEMAGEHDVALHFHCSEHCSVTACEGGYSIAQAGTVLTLLLPQAGTPQTCVYLGSTAPMAGWVSRHFDLKMPAPSIAWRARLAGNTRLRTEIVIGSPAAPALGPGDTPRELAVR
jgi:hypothetical protein